MLRDSEARQSSLTDQEVDLCCEILKILFNLTASMDKNKLDEVRHVVWGGMMCIVLPAWTKINKMMLGMGDNLSCIQGKFRSRVIFALWCEGKFKTGQIEF